MAIFKCKICGGSLDIQPGESIATCEYCGTKQTLPRLDNEKKANLYDRANHFRRNNDYDKAMGIYETILNEDSTDAEAYWSILLCKYGIEYVEDPSKHKHVPTVNRAQYTSIFDDEDYKSAIQYADSNQREIYEAEANTINDIQKGILDISAKEEPFDVFICYKETDASGRRTKDSVLATELYHELTRDGFKVFFSRITLEDKLGTAYEPYIFAALNSAKVMVVVGTKLEHFNAVWVRNEWSRFLSLIKNGAKKTLIPAYRDMDPYDLPEEFSHLQAQDMSKLGFMQDLIRGIKKIVEAGHSDKIIKETVLKNAPSANVAPLLKRAFIFLEDGDWSSADEYCEKVLDIDPECAEAYLGKLMVELKVKKQESLKDQAAPFNNNNNYQKIIRFADDKLKKALEGYVEHINIRIENARLKDIYNRAKKEMNSANTEITFKEAAQHFESISGYEDSASLAKECYEKAETKRLVQERQAEIARKKAEERAKRNKKVAIIATPLLCVIIVFAIVLTTVILPKQKLDKAMCLIDSGDYETAFALLDEIRNTDEKLSTLYNRAISLIDSGDYEPAYMLLNGLNYQDSDEMASKIYVKYRIEKIKSAKVGDYVLFGSYEQDNNLSNGKEEIEWLVLETTGKKVLVVSKYALDSKPYNTFQTDITWETCSLRKWLNDTFLNDAFRKKEQAVILKATVSADENPNHKIKAGNQTKDKIFLLGIVEAEKYFASDDERQCKPTKYAVANGAHFNEENGNCWWWLRTPGKQQKYTTGIFSGGDIRISGYDVNMNEAVRPAMWIDIGDVNE